MDALASKPAPAAGHRRNKSAAVFKSMLASTKNHKRNPSDGTALKANTSNIENIPNPSMPPRQQQQPKEGPSKSLHKRTKSSLSLRSLGKSKEGRSKENNRAQEEREATPKKTKSTNNLAAMLGMSKSRDAGTRSAALTKDKDKENTTPPPSSSAAEPMHTPIWAQFSSQPLQELTTTTKIPLNDRRTVEDEIRLYTPSNYSPSKQRNFGGYGEVPSLKQQQQKRPGLGERPKSTFLPNTGSNGLLETFTRKRGNERGAGADAKGSGEKVDHSSYRDVLRRSNSDSSRKNEEAKQPPPTVKKQSRVMAAVAAFNGKAKEAQATATAPMKLDPQAVEAEFEAVLESRNIPQHQRTAMRTLKLEVKADFVRTHKLETPTVSRAASGQSVGGDSTGWKSVKSTLSRGRKSQDCPDEDREDMGTSGKSSKRERPLSKTFTWGKGDSPVKKQRPDAEKRSSRSLAIPKSPSMRSLISNGSVRSAKGAKPATPDEFVTYMRTMEKVEEVEVGRLHKLRQLLRNETVEWVNMFVQEEGMTELVKLLHRIMEVEWREDHEDQLLHEVLRCLKGLCTTDSALKQLAEVSPTLFPALLSMLFDEEHKGPSEFTTRELVIQIIFAHLSTAPETERHSRARELLKYLKDPVKEKESSTVPFILQMHTPRPYQVWCKEITNVTKEVFWIFIHHLNVIPLPSKSSSDDASATNPPKSYAQTHFPGPRAIVPAAPYVGGVEWDATNYMATHLDLLNGILASLPTKDTRNTLRSELRISGFEKLMGHLRTCNPKYYGAVHDAVKVWVKAAIVDGWDVRVVRMGQGEGKGVSPIKSSPKKKVEEAPRLGEMPRMDLGLGLDMKFGEGKADGKQKVLDDWI